MTRIVILFSALVFLVFASPSQALTFNFSFAGVEGTISDLDDDPVIQSAESVLVTVSPIGGEGEYAPGVPNDFSVSGGIITSADFSSVLSSVVGDYALSLFFNSSGGFGILSDGNNLFLVGDLSFPSSSEVPIPGALPLFATGLGALVFVAYRRRRTKAA